MKIHIDAFEDGQRIPEEYAFGVPASDAPMALGQNKNPEIRWSDVPQGTKSFAIIVHDPDVPSIGDNVNQEGKVVPADLPRVDFYHLVLVDIPVDRRVLPAGADSSEISARGKALGLTEYGRRGYNDYTGWFAGDADMSGDYGGYDGPCPPWNDEIIHHYHFSVFALDVDSLGLRGRFGAAEALQAMEGHVLASATRIGTYSLNPSLET